MRHKTADAAVENMRPALLQVLRALIAARSENPPGSTEIVAAAAEEFLTEYGIASRRRSAGAGKVNLTAIIGNHSPGLVLCGHLDTVPVGNRQRWKRDPFAGTTHEGRIYGRGSADMKGGVAAILTTLAALTYRETDLPTAVTGLLVCDEETGGQLGAKWCAENRVADGKAVLIAEPTNTRRGGHALVGGERGVLWVRLHYEGQPAHGSLPMLGQNAITQAIAPLANFRNPLLRKVRPPHVARTLVRAGKSLLRQEFGRRGHSAPQQGLERYTANLAVIHGGTKTNVVPDSCTAEVDMRIPLGGSRDEAERMIRTLAGDCHIEVFNYAPPSFTPPTARIAALVRRVARRIFGQESPYVVAPYTTDGHHFRAVAGLPTVVYGPGFTDVIHTYDEYVALDDVLGCAKVYAATVLGFHG